GCERPEKTIRRLDGPRSSQCPGWESGRALSRSRPGRGSVSSVVVAPSTDIALLGDLLGWEACERSGGDVVRDDGSRRRPRIVANLDGRNKRIVDRRPDVPADPRSLFRAPGLVREVGGDRPRPDVRALADVGVAD